ncbi:MAG: helix-turn-helix domain-containing protein [Planctomycetales bacterium]|nr:helix-turn-helix domain-containing protein [Planctomycetales bacterium]
MERLSDYAMTAEAAEILGISQTTLRKWAAKGKIAVHWNPANGYRLFRRADLQLFLKQVADTELPPRRPK